MDHTQEVNMYLSSQIVFSHAICSLWTSQSPSCELNNQWLPFWQPPGYLAENRGRETLHVCPEKKTVCPQLPSRIKNATEPFSSFTNFFSHGWQLVTGFRGTNVNWEWHSEMFFWKGSLRWEITALYQSSKCFFNLQTLCFSSWKESPLRESL